MFARWPLLFVALAGSTHALDQSVSSVPVVPAASHAPRTIPYHVRDVVALRAKTTLLNALVAFLPAEDRLVVIEDTAELRLDAPNLVRFEARRAQTDLPAITIRDLLRATLRHRPDRILVGEVRGGEAFDLLQALNTGHSGTLSTIHANAAEQALRRFTSCVLQSGIDLPYVAIRHAIAECLQLLVHLERRRGRRVVTELVRLRGYHPASDAYELESL
jgi:pilus assembly protein CpaF